MPKYDPEFEERLIEAQNLFVWEMPAYERHDRGSKWYIIMAIVVAAFSVYALWTTNYLFAFIVLISAIILVLAGNEKPEKVLVQIGENGIVLEGNFLPFEDINQFAIVYQPPNIKVLYLYPRSLVLYRKRVYLGDQDPVEIRNHLRRYVKEDLNLRDEHLSDLLAKIFKL